MHLLIQVMITMRRCLWTSLKAPSNSTLRQISGLVSCFLRCDFLAVNFVNTRFDISSVFKDEKGADDGGVFIEEEPNDQESNEPTDTVNKMASEVPKDDTRKTPPQTEEKPGNLNPLGNEESAKESPPKKQVPKNIVTSWSDWVAKTTTSVNKETKENTTTSTSQSDQESNEPTDPVNKMASEIPEIPKEDTQKTPPQTEEEPENLNPLANEELAKESPKKHVPKNIVTSWSDWVAKTTTSVSNKEPEKSTTTSTSPPRVKRLAELFLC